MTRLKTQCVFLFKNQEKFVIRIKGKKMWDLFLNSSVKQQPIHTAKLALFGALVWLQISILNRANGKALFGKMIRCKQSAK